MRVLLDTNIIIHREATRPVLGDVGELFRWIDNLHYYKCVHPLTLTEIERLNNSATRSAMMIKLDNYNVLKTTAQLDPEVQAVARPIDTSSNDEVDTAILNEVYMERVDALITEDRKIHQKAMKLGIAHKVYTISGFLEKVTVEHPDLLEYKVPLVTKEYFGAIDLRDDFFDSFREDYHGFDRWFNRKSDEVAYVCRSEGKLLAFLYLKVEDENEAYSDITPPFERTRRLKIGTLKVRMTGFKIGEGFLKIVFDNAIRFKVKYIYVTIFPKGLEREALIRLLMDFGFVKHGQKQTSSGVEDVYVRYMGGPASLEQPSSTFPFISRRARKFIVPIYPEYHTSLFPDSILKTESPMEFVEQEPFRNAIRKVYVSRSWTRDLRSGDVVLFYRTGGLYKSVVTTLGIVEKVTTNLSDFNQLVNACGKRTVFTQDELRRHWDYNPRTRPFVVEFLYAYSLPKRPNLAKLIEMGVVQDVSSAPRGFEPITEEAFRNVLSASEADPSVVVD